VAGKYEIKLTDFGFTSLLGLPPNHHATAVAMSVVFYMLLFGSHPFYDELDASSPGVRSQIKRRQASLHDSGSPPASDAAVSLLIQMLSNHPRLGRQQQTQYSVVVLVSATRKGETHGILKRYSQDRSFQRHIIFLGHILFSDFSHISLFHTSSFAFFAFF
jgi:serine/threonine protein kinase